MGSPRTMQPSMPISLLATQQQPVRPGIAHTADVVIALSQEEDDIEAGIINAKFLKNRYGKNHVRDRLSIDYETLVIDAFEEKMGDDGQALLDGVSTSKAPAPKNDDKDDFGGLF